MAQQVSQNEGKFLAGHVAYLDMSFDTSYINLKQSSKYNQYVMARQLDAAYLNGDWNNVLHLAALVASSRNPSLVVESHAMEFLIIDSFYQASPSMQLHLDRMHDIYDTLHRPIPLQYTLLKAWSYAKNGDYTAALETLQKPPPYLVQDIALFGPILTLNKFFIERLAGTSTQDIENFSLPTLTLAS